MKSCVLLDMGGVVLRVGSSDGLPASAVDFRGREAMLAMLARAGRKLTLEDLDGLLFGPWRLEHARRHDLARDAAWEPHLERLCRAAGVEIDRWQLLGAWFRPYAERLQPADGAEDALARLKEMGKRLALVSNVPLPGRFYEAILEGYGLKRYFDALCFSYDLGTRKPSPALLRRALAKLDATPEQALMVGDKRSADVAAGRAARVVTVWVRSPFDDGPLPDYEIGSLAELPELVEAIQ